MTVNTTKITSGPYAGNDVADTFSYTFRVVDKTQLSVYETDDQGSQTLLTVDVDYTVNNIGNDSGGTIVRLAGPLPNNYEWFIRSNFTETQLTAFQSQGAFFPDLHEDAMDKLTLLIQQLIDKNDRSFRLTDVIDIDGNFVITQKASDRAGLALGFDSLGNLVLKTAFDPGLIDQSDLDTRYNVIVPTVAVLKSSNPVDISGNPVSLAVGMIVKTQGYYSAGDSGAAFYLIAANQSVDGYGDHLLTNTNVALLQENSSSPLFTQYGAKANDNTFDSYPAINAAITKFITSADYPIFDFRGDTFYGNTPLAYSSNFKMMNGVYEYKGSANDIAIIDVGDFNGDTLTRGATVENMRARISTSSTNTGIRGIRLKGLVRSCSIRDCVAELFGDVEGTKDHVGFEILANRIAASTSAGAYQNVIDTCTALFANTGFRIRTAGTQVEAEGDPQANGNYLKKCFAFSCRQKALDLSYGSQENECEVRADTFPTQTGLGTRIDVVNVDGRFNHVDLIEEIGSRADTQYTVRIGDTAIYNIVNASTQQIVSGFLDDSSSPQGKREKNVVKQLGSALLDAKDEDTFQFYGSVPASSSQAIQAVIPIRKKCVVTSCQIFCTSAAGASSDTRGYFAKNNGFSTVNRVILPAGTAANTVVDKKIDTSAAIDINAAWSYESGDRLSIAFDIPGDGPQTMGAVVTVKYI